MSQLPDAMHQGPDRPCHVLCKAQCGNDRHHRQAAEDHNALPEMILVFPDQKANGEKEWKKGKRRRKNKQFGEDRQAHPLTLFRRHVQV